MPTIGVTVIITDQQGYIVLTKRNDLPVWCLPGGHVESGESLVEAAVREVKEETGLEIKITRLVGIYSRPHWFDGNHDIVFAAVPVGGQLKADQVETVEIGFFDRSALPEPLLAWNVVHIDDAFSHAQTFVRSLEVGFPLKNMTRREFSALRQQGQIPFADDVTAALCASLPPEKNCNEIDV